MQSTARNVSSYIDESPEERQETLTRLRHVCLEILTGYEESMEYGMPCYRKNGAIEVAFASQKNYISLYIMKEDVVRANHALLKGLSVGKGCIRYTSLKKINLDVIRKLLEDTIRSAGSPC